MTNRLDIIARNGNNGEHYLQTEQVGGDHYQMKIQPITFIMQNNLSYCVGNIVKYICRYQKKNGKEDLLKARQYIDFILENEYGS